MAGLDSDHSKIEVLRYKNEGLSSREIAELTGISKSAINYFLAKDTHKDWWEVNDKPIAAGTIRGARSKIPHLKGNTFIITSAQNNTYVHENFLKAIENYAERNSAQIIVGTFTYNKNGFQNGEKDEHWFDPKIKNYILDEETKLADDLLWCGNLNILPTAVNPLSGLHSYTEGMSGIIPHAKVQMESLPRQKFEAARILHTTGTVTMRNYIQQKAGQKASFHHVFGALVVEIDNDGDWFVRQVIADGETGGFYDLDKLYLPNGDMVDNTPAAAINWGDIHVEKLDEEVRIGAFAENGTSMLDVLKPKHQFIHDVLDFEARNHHSIKDPYHRFLIHNTDKDNVEINIKSVAAFLHYIERHDSTPVVVESNHDLAFIKWLKEADYKTDPENAIYFLESQLAQYKAMREGKRGFSIFEHAVKRFIPDTPAIFLRVDESFRICDEYGGGIECGNHGHLGINGTRGGISAFQKLGARQNVGHSHTPAIKDGVYYAGVSGSLDMGYNLGSSTWLNAHIVTYPNGKRTIVVMRGRKWRRT